GRGAGGSTPPRATGARWIRGGSRLVSARAQSGLAEFDFTRYKGKVQRPVLRGLIALAAATAALGVLAAAQGGTFPGANGRLAFTCGTSLCTINPDGTNRKTLI